LEDFIKTYKALIPLYQEFVEEIIFSVSEFSADLELDFADIKGRVKSIESVQNKIQKYQLQNPEKEIFDFAGVRILCLFESDFIHYEKLLKQHFQIIWHENKKEKLGIDKMGYQSSHFSIKFGNRFNGPRYRKFKDLICEVQITTVLMDAWGLISHKLVYKSVEAIPIELQRDLNNVASLIEIAQSTFNHTNEKREEYLNDLEHQKKLKILVLKEPINYESLKIYSEQYFPKLEISNYWQNELIRDLDKSKYSTIKDIHDKVQKAKSFVKYYMKKSPEYFEYSTDIITKSLGYLDEEYRNKHNWSWNTLHEFKVFKDQSTN